MRDAAGARVRRDARRGGNAFPARRPLSHGRESVRHRASDAPLQTSRSEFLVKRGKQAKAGQSTPVLGVTGDGGVAASGRADANRHDRHVQSIGTKASRPQSAASGGWTARSANSASGIAAVASLDTASRLGSSAVSPHGVYVPVVSEDEAARSSPAHKSHKSAGRAGGRSVDARGVQCAPLEPTVFSAAVGEPYGASGKLGHGEGPADDSSPQARRNVIERAVEAAVEEFDRDVGDPQRHRIGAEHGIFSPGSRRQHKHGKRQGHTRLGKHGANRAAIGEWSPTFGRPDAKTVPGRLRRPHSGGWRASERTTPGGGAQGGDDLELFGASIASGDSVDRHVTGSGPASSSIRASAPGRASSPGYHSGHAEIWQRPETPVSPGRGPDREAFHLAAEEWRPQMMPPLTCTLGNQSTVPAFLRRDGDDDDRQQYRGASSAMRAGYVGNQRQSVSRVQSLDQLWLHATEQLEDSTNRAVAQTLSSRFARPRTGSGLAPTVIPVPVPRSVATPASAPKRSASQPTLGSTWRRSQRRLAESARVSHSGKPQRAARAPPPSMVTRSLPVDGTLLPSPAVYFKRHRVEMRLQEQELSAVQQRGGPSLRGASGLGTPTWSSLRFSSTGNESSFLDGLDAARAQVAAHTLEQEVGGSGEPNSSGHRLEDDSSMMAGQRPHPSRRDGGRGEQSAPQEIDPQSTDSGGRADDDASAADEVGTTFITAQLTSDQLENAGALVVDVPDAPRAASASSSRTAGSTTSQKSRRRPASADAVAARTAVVNTAAASSDHGQDNSKIRQRRSTPGRPRAHAHARKRLPPSWQYQDHAAEAGVELSQRRERVPLAMPIADLGGDGSADLWVADSDAANALIRLDAVELADEVEDGSRHQFEPSPLRASLPPPGPLRPVTAEDRLREYEAQHVAPFVQGAASDLVGDLNSSWTVDGNPAALQRKRHRSLDVAVGQSTRGSSEVGSRVEAKLILHRTLSSAASVDSDGASDATAMRRPPPGALITFESLPPSPTPKVQALIDAKREKSGLYAALSDEVTKQVAPDGSAGLRRLQLWAAQHGFLEQSATAVADEFAASLMDTSGAGEYQSSVVLGAPEHAAESDADLTPAVMNPVAQSVQRPEATEGAAAEASAVVRDSNANALVGSYAYLRVMPPRIDRGSHQRAAHDGRAGSSREGRGAEESRAEAKPRPGSASSLKWKPGAS